MGFKIVSGKNQEGHFVDAAEAWTQDKIEALLIKYNPKGHLSRQREADQKKED